jgi:hypothetical protein
VGPRLTPGYRYCWLRDPTLGNAAVAFLFAVVLVLLCVALASLVVVYWRLRMLARPARAVLHRHAAYVIIFLVLWMLQVSHVPRPCISSTSARSTRSPAASLALVVEPRRGILTLPSHFSVSSAC